MRLTDAVNGGFELGAACFTALNVRRIWRDRRVLGASPWAFGFFFTWGLFNLTYYYPALHQPFSWCCGFAVTASNLAWVILAIRFRNPPADTPPNIWAS